MPQVKAVIFDLDGVIATTDRFHYTAWKKAADELGIHFDEAFNDRLRGVSRMEALDLILGDKAEAYGPDEKQAIADRKNAAYRAMLPDLGPADRLPGVDAALALLTDTGVQVAIGSSSRNAPDILRYLGLEDAFEAVVSGNDIERSKPFPDVFLIAAERMGVAPADCLVVEDAAAGIEAAKAAGMRALSVGPEPLPGADLHLPDLTGFSLDVLSLPEGS